MGKGKWVIVLLTALLLLTAAFGQKAETENRIPAFILSAQGNTEKLASWEKEPGEYYVFLPSYGQLSQLQFRDEDGGAVKIGDILLQDGMTCQGFRLNQRYPLEDVGGNGQKGITFVQSAQLPALFLDTDSHSMGYIHQKKGNEETGSLRLYSPEGTADYSGRLESIKMRGNNTMYQEKKPYSLKLSQEADLLGMGAAQKWILLSNSFDPSHMRNKIIYDFASELGLTYSPECRWVDVYLNGEYAGLYLLTERNEVHPQRVALTADEHFLVSEEIWYRLEEQNLPRMMTASGIPLRIFNCSLDLGTLGEIWYNAEQAIFGENGVDPNTGVHWSERIDLDSWAKKYLIEEVFGNVDGALASQFYYMDGSYPGAKIYAGPVWDYDMAMGNRIYWEAVIPEMLYVNRPEICGGSSWYHALCQDKVFRDYMIQMYTQQFLPLLNVFLDEKAAGYQALIGQAAQINQLRWETEPLEPEIEHMKDYMRQRVEFLNHIWLDGEDGYVTLSIAEDPSLGIYSTYAVQPGEPAPPILWNLDGAWYTLEEDKPFDMTQPITSDVRVYQKEEEEPPVLEEKAAFPEWSAFAVVGLLLIILCMADRSSLRKTEGRGPNAR